MTPSYDRLMDDHDGIDAAARELAALAAAAVPQPAAARDALHRLDRLMRDHGRIEDDVLYATVDAAALTRHGDAARNAHRDLQDLTNDWTAYTGRWRAGVAPGSWSDFAANTAAVVDKLQRRLQFEGAVLYSLALHHDVVVPHG